MSVHARRRFKQRTGLPMRAANRHARMALDEGKRPRDLPFFHRDQLRAMNRRHDPSGKSFTRVHGGVAYVFARLSEDRVVLITVLPFYDEAPG